MYDDQRLLGYTEEEWAEIMYGPTKAQIEGPVQAPKSMGDMTISAGPTKPAPDYKSLLMYAGLGLAVLMILKRR
jgi:hypothetical protein